MARDPPIDALERPLSRVLDEYLVVECQLGNEEAFTAIVRRWHARFLSQAERLTQDREAALDVVQESWIGIVRGLRSLRDPGRFHSWATRIVANKARDWIRRERSRRGVAAKVGVEDRGMPSPNHALARVREGIAALEPGQRSLLRRYYLERHSVAEIAAELGIPDGTVKSRLSKARNDLRRSLEED